MTSNSIKRHSIAALGFAAFLAGCAPTMSATWQSAWSLVRPDMSVDTATLNPGLRYLRVQVHGTAVLMVLGNVDTDPATGKPVEVWYSADRHVLRLIDGRMVSISGLPMEWRSVRLPNELPPWQAVKAPHEYTRERDEMPGYRIGLIERVRLAPIAPVTRSALRQLEPERLAWFEERTDGLRPARYGVANAQVVYGEQCLTSDLCVSWQQWPPRQAVR